MTLTWSDAKDRIIIWMGASLMLLLGWLVLGQVAMQKDLNLLVAESKYDKERDARIDKHIERLYANDSEISRILDSFRIQAAKHGWGVGE